MVSDYTIQEQIRKIEVSTSHEEHMYNILDLYMNLFPVENAYLFRYSPFGFLGEGIILITTDGLSHIREIRDDIRSLPIIYSAICERKAKFCSGIEYLKQTSSKYIFPSSVSSMIAVPICFGTVVVGYICSTEFKNELKMDEKLLSSFTYYGKLIGKFLENTTGAHHSIELSKRELEVMKRIAWGESTKEMADSMNISELTVKQYVKSAIKKLGANNRSHAVGELIRKGIIS
ncbi:helix-turn-helix transcriptional regulator [Bacillus sp. AFS002410]|uniref:response regulator transcription factor n=1 Tax=Bacillus sp. AFS002410 TaxID=2033481 RepID=UPI000BF19CCC|nr:helix-turn-helix transcriptional regulator [Bacillus sp. AFS002410]PEJ59010.1 helix-turn-helix transcriptional regulator [Bacillus sp. AFS002410]